MRFQTRRIDNDFRNLRSDKMLRARSGMPSPEKSATEKIAVEYGAGGGT